MAIFHISFCCEFIGIKFIPDIRLIIVEMVKYIDIVGPTYNRIQQPPPEIDSQIYDLESALCTHMPKEFLPLSLSL